MGQIGYWTRGPIVSFESAFNRIFSALERDIWENDLGSFIRMGENKGFPYSDVIIDKESKNLMFRISLAGYEPKDIKITFEDDRLIISSDGTKVDISDNAKYLEHGIKTSAFKVSYALSSAKYHTGAEAVKAVFTNGVLTILVPAREESKPKSISISEDVSHLKLT